MIDDKLKEKLMKIFSKYNEIEKVVLFSSKEQRDNKYNSDVHLCMFGEEVTHLTLAKIYLDIDELNTSLSFNILHFQELSKKELIKNILEEGMIIYNN